MIIVKIHALSVTLLPGLIEICIVVHFQMYYCIYINNHVTDQFFMTLGELHGY